MVPHRRPSEGAPATVAPSDRICRFGDRHLIGGISVAGSSSLMSDWFPTESYPPDEFGSSQELTSETDVPLREGLPPGYRMRHDRHYVDELDSRSPAALVRMLPARDISARMPVTLASTDSLVESVRRVGILQPLLVRRREIGYELIAGVRRFAAAAAAGLTELPCRVYNVGDDEARLLAEADDVRQSLPIAERVREPKETQPSLAAALAEISRSLGAMGRSGISRARGHRARTHARFEL